MYRTVAVWDTAKLTWRPCTYMGDSEGGLVYGILSESVGEWRCMGGRVSVWEILRVYDLVGIRVGDWETCWEYERLGGS